MAEQRLHQLVSQYVNLEEVDTSLLKTLLKAFSPDRKYDVVSKVRSDWRRTAVQIAAWKSDIEMLECVMESLEEGKKLKLMKMKTMNGNTPAHCAAWRGDTETLRYLLHPLTSKARYQMLKMSNVDDATPIHCAADNGHTGAIKYMLELLPPDQQIELMDAQARYDQTALDVATTKDHRPTMDCLRLCRQSAEAHLKQLKGRKRETDGDNTAWIQQIGEDVVELRARLEKLEEEKDFEAAKKREAVDELRDQLKKQKELLSDKDGQIRDLTAKIDTLTAQLAKVTEKQHMQNQGKEPPAVTTTAVLEECGIKTRESVTRTTSSNNNNTDLRLNNTIEWHEGLKDERWE